MDMNRVCQYSRQDSYVRVYRHQVISSVSNSLTYSCSLIFIIMLHQKLIMIGCYRNVLPCNIG